MTLAATPASRLVIFDCDGVLVDSELLACEVEARGLTRSGYPITGPEVAARFLGTSARDMQAAVERELGRALPADYAARQAADLAEQFRRALKPVRGIGAVIARVAEAGAAVCVASSSSPGRIALSLGLVGLHDRFAPHIFSSSMVERGKPAPDLFLHAADRMAVRSEHCIVVEDSVAGVTAARRAGMRVLGFTGGSHCGPGHAERLSATGADQCCGSAEDLGRALAEALAHPVDSASVARDVSPIAPGRRRRARNP